MLGELTIGVKWSGQMDLIETSLRYLHDHISRFIEPSAALRDARCLKAQIALRGQVLRDIPGCRVSRSRLATGRVRRSI
jgi:hypothetical protein